MSAAADRHTTVRAHSLHAHLFEVHLHIARPAADQVLSLPVWIAGSYLVREFAKHLQDLQATQDGQPVAVHALDKCSWKIGCSPDQPVDVRYKIYAFDNSVRSAWLSAERGFFNSTSICLQVHGQTHLPHALTLCQDGLPPAWQATCALAPLAVQADGFGTYQASDYEALVDAPVEWGDFWRGQFTAHGVPHRVVVAGAPPSFDGARLLADTQAICEAEMAFWHGADTAAVPHHHYLFLINAVADGYGGLEHRTSTALLCTRADLPRLGQSHPPTATDGYTRLLGLISHEYFHTWNVKRLRPAEFTRYDFSRENPTQLLWFFEGFTSYYDDLLLHRAGLISAETYLQLLSKTVQQVLQTPGREVQSVAQASWDAWIKYYRPDENTANATVSYYSKGALVALCLDLSLRQTGRCTLDEVMRALWLRCQGGPMTEADLLAVLAQSSGQDWAERLHAWVHTTAELPVLELLAAHGVRVERPALGWAERLGLRTGAGTSVQVKSVLRGAAAEAAGLCAGDEWLGVELATPQGPCRWRLQRLDDLPLLLGTATHCQAWVSRDQRLLSLPLRIPEPALGVNLALPADLPADSPAYRWLAGS
jgi:predicted metalloprotease with PDZ domain